MLFSHFATEGKSMGGLAVLGRVRIGRVPGSGADGVNESPNFRDRGVRDSRGIVSFLHACGPILLPESYLPLPSAPGVRTLRVMRRLSGKPLYLCGLFCRFLLRELWRCPLLFLYGSPMRRAVEGRILQKMQCAPFLHPNRLARLRCAFPAMTTTPFP